MQRKPDLLFWATRASKDIFEWIWLGKASCFQPQPGHRSEESTGTKKPRPRRRKLFRLRFSLLRSFFLRSLSLIGKVRPSYTPDTPERLPFLHIDVSTWSTQCPRNESKKKKKQSGRSTPSCGAPLLTPQNPGVPPTTKTGKKKWEGRIHTPTYTQTRQTKIKYSRTLWKTFTRLSYAPICQSSSTTICHSELWYGTLQRCRIGHLSSSLCK